MKSLTNDNFYLFIAFLIPFYNLTNKKLRVEREFHSLGKVIK